MEKKVIYLEIDDEVSAACKKLQDVKSKDVYIVIPKRAIIFQSVVNLKILKRKAADEEKKIYFITNDKNGLYLAKRAGIEIYDKSEHEGVSKILAKEEDEESIITPIKAAVNAIDEEAPTRLKEKKLSISELLKKARGHRIVRISQVKNNEKAAQKKKSKFVIVAPNRHALFGLVIASVFILLVIIYIALPGATVSLLPAAGVLETSVNITLADYQRNTAELETHPTHMIASYPIEVTATKTITHYSTGKKFSERGSNAGGKITIYNTSSGVWPLIEQTRFQTADGIIFRILSPVEVPAATVSGPGKIETVVRADQTDVNGQIVGERGNIEPSKFFLPGLREESRSKIYAESSVAMSGGVTDYVDYVTAEDLTAAENRIKDEIVKGAVEQLQAAVKQKSELVGDNTLYVLLDGEGAIKLGDINISLDKSLVGGEQKEFTVTGEVLASGVYYDHDEMLEILKNELLLKKSPQKELLRINEDSTSYRIFDWDLNRGKIKLTANIKGIEQYEIDPEKENGARLLQKIKEHIVGRNIEEAILYIQNLPEINKVSIKTWPAWSPSLPSISDNIDFEIQTASNIE